MKKLLILFMAFGLVAASCKNDKGKAPYDRDNTNRDKDDYKNTREDDRGNTNRDRDEDDDSYSNNDGWSSSDKRQWMGLCATDEVKQSLGEERANKYCECVLEKLEARYPSLKKANSSGSYEEGKELGQQLGMDCISELGGGQ